MKDIKAMIDERFGKDEPVEVVNKITDGLDIEIPRPLKKKKSSNNEGKAQNELLQFFMGFLLFGGGLYWVFNSFTVSSSWGYGYWGIGSLRMPMGTMLIPLLVGIGLLFFFEKKAIGGFVCALGVLIILISLLTSLSFHATSGTLYTYILMFGMVAAGAALLIRVLFKPNSKKSDD
ncbi:MAG: hypothetical protein K6F91_06100 [Ruminococcus sp.]|nr:hypothetical protein [Ruminococcus sp.]